MALLSDSDSDPDTGLVDRLSSCWRWRLRAALDALAAVRSSATRAPRRFVRSAMFAASESSGLHENVPGGGDDDERAGARADAQYAGLLCRERKSRRARPLGLASESAKRSSGGKRGPVTRGPERNIEWENGFSQAEAVRAQVKRPAEGSD